MKKPIAWHEECARNFEDSVREEEERFVRLSERVARAREDLAFRWAQINEARRKKLDGFDADKFLRDRKGNRKKV